MFFKRRFGRDIAELVSDPMCRGIFASNSRTLGISAVFPHLVKGEYENRSILKSMYMNKVHQPEFVGNSNEFALKAKLDGWRIMNFNHGMEQFPRAILNILRDRQNVDIYENSPVDHISVRNPSVTVTVKDGKPRHSDYIVSALPSFALAHALRDEKIGKSLSEIKFVDVAHVSLEFRDISLDHQAFGCLIPSYENPVVLGIIFDSAIFPESDTTEYKSCRMSLMIGGEWFEKYLGDPRSCSHDLIRTMALDTVKQYLKITAEPSHCHVDILEKCIPHYTIGHRNRVKHLFRLIKEDNLRLSLIGSSYSGVGVPDLVSNAIDHTEPLHTIINERYYGYNPALEEDVITPKTEFMANFEEYSRRQRGF
jgi:oxygen-dependent protoporphyrinogen oxidase